MNAPKISIIVPVYKVEKYLHRCLDSILGQTFIDWECILVDDGSPDFSGAICDEYAAKDSRIHVIHKDNEGVSKARNVGLKNASGEWISFVDSDDSLYDNALEILYSYVADDCDLVMAGYTTVREDGSVRTAEAKKRNAILTREEAIKEMFSPSDYPYQGYSVCKLFRKRNIIDYGIGFDVNIYFNEDRLFVVEYLCAACKKKVYYTTEAVYRIFKRGSSAMGSLNRYYNAKFVTDMDAYAKMLTAIKKNVDNPTLIKMAKNGCVASYCNNHAMMKSHGVYDAQAHKHLVRLLHSNGLLISYYKLAFKHFAVHLLMHLAPKIAIRKKNNAKI